MIKNKTQATDASVNLYLDAISDEQRRHDCSNLMALIEQISNYKAIMWGTAIVGFGERHYHYESGRSGSICLIGFASRKNEFALYGFNAGENATSEMRELLSQLGKYKTGKGCLYIRRLSDVNADVLGQMIKHVCEGN